jgi:hypothetical protein
LDAVTWVTADALATPANAPNSTNTAMVSNPARRKRRL